MKPSRPPARLVVALRRLVPAGRLHGRRTAVRVAVSGTVGVHEAAP